MQYAVELAKDRNVSQTAERLGITQPALSKHILALEKELGVKLFDRSTSPITSVLSPQRKMYSFRLFFSTLASRQWRIDRVSSSVMPLKKGQLFNINRYSFKKSPFVLEIKHTCLLYCTILMTENQERGANL